jgi:hypothetical protein
MPVSRRIFDWLTPELALQMVVLAATAAGALCLLKTRADISDMELDALKVRVAAVEAQADQTNLLATQSKVRLDDQERLTEQLRVTTESIRGVLNEVAGDMKAVKALLMRGQHD